MCLSQLWGVKYEPSRHDATDPHRFFSSEFLPGRFIKIGDLRYGDRLGVETVGAAYPGCGYRV